MIQIDDIKTIQKKLFDVLLWFASFCDENDLKFFLANGTLLGAVKYQSFVPWDDDVDILMPREDYDKFILLANQKKSNDDFKYSLMCTQTVSSWRMPYAKLSDDTTLVKEGEFDFGATFGLSVDIFPLDRWCPVKPLAKCQALYGDVLKRMLVFSNGEVFETRQRGIKKLMLKSMWTCGHIAGHHRISAALAERGKNSQRYKSKYLGCVVWTCHSFHEVLPADVFEKSVDLTFCGHTFPAPAGYIEYLDSLYGDWRKELPIEKQVSNHQIKVWFRDEE